MQSDEATLPNFIFLLSIKQVKQRKLIKHQSTECNDYFILQLFLKNQFRLAEWLALQTGMQGDPESISIKPKLFSWIDCRFELNFNLELNFFKMGSVLIFYALKRIFKRMQQRRLAMSSSCHLQFGLPCNCVGSRWWSIAVEANSIFFLDSQAGSSWRWARCKQLCKCDDIDQATVSTNAKNVASGALGSFGPV